jgi:hypothetical protein
MSEINRSSLIKPTLNTPFRIDFDWWKANDTNWHVHLQGLLCNEHREIYSKLENGQLIDWVDPETAEVRQLDALQSFIMNHCAKQDNFISDHTVVVDAIFRLFLSNGNVPLTSEEIGALLQRPALTVLKTISGLRVYRGLRPYIE